MNERITLADQALPLRVVKVGGSLFDFDGLPNELSAWIGRQPPARNLLLAGGGDWAEALRAVDRRFDLGEEISHRLCIRAMSVTANLLAALLPGSQIVSQIDQIAHSENRIIVFDPGPFWLADERTQIGDPLPSDWGVTSDSIAARLAEWTVAEELVLLKSAEPPTGVGTSATFESLANVHYVDKYFPQAARKLKRVRIVNLRTSSETPIAAANRF